MHRVVHPVLVTSPGLSLLGVHSPLFVDPVVHVFELQLKTSRGSLIGAALASVGHRPGVKDAGLLEHNIRRSGEGAS